MTMIRVIVGDAFTSNGCSAYVTPARFLAGVRPFSSDNNGDIPTRSHNSIPRSMVSHPTHPTDTYTAAHR